MPQTVFIVTTYRLLSPSWNHVWLFTWRGLESCANAGYMNLTEALINLFLKSFCSTQSFLQIFSTIVTWDNNVCTFYMRKYLTCKSCNSKFLFREKVVLIIHSLWLSASPSTITSVSFVLQIKNLTCLLAAWANHGSQHMHHSISSDFESNLHIT